MERPLFDFQTKGVNGKLVTILLRRDTQHVDLQLQRIVAARTADSWWSKQIEKRLIPKARTDGVKGQLDEDVEDWMGN